MAPPKLIFLANRTQPQRLFNGLFCTALNKLGDLQILEHTGEWSDGKTLEVLQANDIVLTGWGARKIPDALASQPGKVRYICHLTGEMRNFISETIIKSAIPVTNWGDAPARGIAEGTLTLLLACLKNLRLHCDMRANGHWWDIPDETQGILQGLNVGIFGMGVIARKTVEMLRVFEPNLLFFDPYFQGEPEDTQRMQSLEDLCRSSHALLVMAGLNEQTRGCINADVLALLPDNAIVINTARGAIIDEDALFAELKSGRLRAGLDVLTNDRELEAGHPVRSLSNVIITGHKIGRAGWPPGERLADLHRIALDNIQRALNGEPLRFIMDERRYALST